jgi:hypothetical protein
MTNSDRRSFIKKTAIAGVGLGLAGRVAGISSPDTVRLLQSPSTIRRLALGTEDIKWWQPFRMALIIFWIGKTGSLNSQKK